MTLSPKAVKYIKGLTRTDKWTCDRETVIDYFNGKEFPSFEPLIDFQVNFSGLKLVIENEPGYSFLLRLFSNKEISKKEALEYWQTGNDYWLDCGIYETAQFNFYINQNGEICTDNGNVPNIIHSSVHKMVEQYAMENKLSGLYENPYYYNIGNLPKLKAFLQQEQFYTIGECSDKYTAWFTNADIIVRRGTWLDKPEFYLHFYAKNEGKCKQMIDRLTNDKIIG